MLIRDQWWLNDVQARDSKLRERGESSLVKYHLEEAHEGIEDTYIYEWIMKRLRDVWKWNPFSPFGSYALLYIEKSMHIEWLSSNGRPCYIYDHIYIYMRIYPTKYILYLYLAKQLDKQHLLKLYTLINVGRARRYLRCCEWILYDSSKGYFLYIFVSFAKI